VATSCTLKEKTTTKGNTMAITGLQVIRYESGCGYSFRVEFTITATYSDQDPFTSGRMPATTLLSQLEGGKIPQNLASQVGRFGGSLVRTGEGWSLGG
jgi:hypothetical protein